MIPFAKVHLDKTGLNANDEIQVILELDTSVRKVTIPMELRRALETHQLVEAFDSVSYTRRKEFAELISNAKHDETKKRRLEKIIDELRAKN